MVQFFFEVTIVLIQCVVDLEHLWVLMQITEEILP